MVETIKSKVSDFRTYWKIPMPGRYMPFKEIMAYAVGGMGAYLIITMASILIVSTNNMVVSAAVGVSPTHMYILYIISTIANIPLTALRANMVDNTREQLLNQIWGYDYVGDTRTVDVHIKRIREKIDGASDKWELRTVWARGYKFVTND